MGREHDAQSKVVEAGRPQDRDRAHGGGLAHHRALRHLQERAKPERGAAVSELLLQRGGAAIAARHLYPSLLPFAGQGEAGRQPLSSIKLLKSDPAAVPAQSEDIKARYTKLFKV